MPASDVKNVPLMIRTGWFQRVIQKLIAFVPIPPPPVAPAAQVVIAQLVDTKR